MAIDNLDEKIVEEAEILIRRDGLLGAKMTELSSILGISRSTLYRHYNNMIEIAMPIQRRYITDLERTSFVPDSKKSGYENLKGYVDSYFENLCAYPDKVYFIVEFDVIYNRTYSPFMIDKSDRTAEHREWNRMHRSPITLFYEEGVRDGSISDDGQGSYKADVIDQAILGIVGRIIPKEDAFVIDHGHGRELARDAVRMLLESIRIDAREDTEEN